MFVFDILSFMVLSMLLGVDMSSCYKSSFDFIFILPMSNLPAVFFQLGFNGDDFCEQEDNSGSVILLDVIAS